MKKKTVFYSWQSDLPHDTNKEFIKKSIQKALSKVNQTLKIVNSPRDNSPSLELDHDIKNIPGTPPIVDSIFDKINNCNIFIADFSFIAKAKMNQHTRLIKSVPNPNVMIEYGYACKTLGYNRIISVMNTAFGKPKPEIMPFNYRHVDFPIQYELSPDSNPRLKSKATKLLVGELTNKIKLIYNTNTKTNDTLSAEILGDSSKFYILKNSKLWFTLDLKITNKNQNPTSIKLSNVELMIYGEWIKTTKSRFIGARIETINKGTLVSAYLVDKIVKYEQEPRLDSMSIDNFCFAYELPVGEFIDTLIKSNTIKVRGKVESVDNRTCEFEGTIEAYKG